MAQQKPLSYQALKILMEHMEANQRYTLAARCPSFRNIHQIVPLTIQYLKLGGNSITLNSIEHTFQTYMRYPYSACFQQNQTNGKIDFDLDQYGNRDHNADIMFGDLELRNVIVQPLDRGHRNEFLFQAMLPGIIEENQRNGGRNQDYLALERAAQRYRSWVVCTFERDSNQGRAKASVNYTEGVNIKTAFRNHLRHIFNSQTLVKYLEIDVPNGILRFPENLKLRVHTLSVKSGVLETISQILTDSSFPLKQLTLEPMISDDLDFQNELLLSSERLHIKWNGFLSQELLETIKNLPNKNIHLSGGLITSVETLVRNWTKPIGTKLSIQHTDVAGYLEIILENMAVLRRVLPGKKSEEFPYCATVRSNDAEDDWELNIYGDKISNYEGKLLNNDDRNPWMLVFEIMEIGTAKVEEQQKSRKREHAD